MMREGLSAFGKLQEWYRSQCDGAWEHAHGISIETLDNPGWTVTIDLVDTGLASKRFKEIEVSMDDGADWYRCWVQDQAFHAACGPQRLTDVIEVFNRWSATASE